MKLTSFQCQRCGICCQVPGYVALTPDEIGPIATFLGMKVHAFTAEYTRLTFNRTALSLIERTDGSCIFLQPDHTCRIQPVKPEQCRGFPTRWKSRQLQAQCPELLKMRSP